MCAIISPVTLDLQSISLNIWEKSWFDPPAVCCCYWSYFQVSQWPGFTAHLEQISGRNTQYLCGADSWPRGTCLDERWPAPLKTNPTGILWIWIPSMCDFPRMLSLICLRRADGNEGLKGLQLGGSFNFCSSVLLYDSGSAEVFFSFLLCLSGQLWRWGPLSPQGHNSTNECLVVGSLGASAHKKGFIGAGMLTFNHDQNNLLSVGKNKARMNVSALVSMSQEINKYYRKYCD